jgi:hypothetical protein
MALTPAQATALKAAIDSTPAWAAYPNTTDGNIDLCDQKLNKIASPDFQVWVSNFDVSTLLDNVDQSKYTPNDNIAQGNTDVASLTRIQARAIYCQTKLMVLQNYVIGRATVNMGPPKVRASLLDCLTAIPAGANGAAVDAASNAGNAVFSKATRSALEGERVLCKASAGTDTTATTTARVMGFEGNLTPADVAQARALP